MEILKKRREEEETLIISADINIDYEKVRSQSTENGNKTPTENDVSKMKFNDW